MIERAAEPPSRRVEALPSTARPGKGTGRGTGQSLRHPLLAMQRSAGNRATAGLVRRLAVQRSIDDDLRGRPTPVPAGQQVEIPAGRILMTVNGQRMLVPCRVYEIDQVPTALDRHSMHTESRHEFIPGTIAERVMSGRDNPNLTVGELRAHAQRSRGSVRVALAQWDGAVHLVGADTVQISGGQGYSGFVVAASGSAGLGRELLVRRLRTMLDRGAGTMNVEVGVSTRTLEFHRQVLRVARIDNPGIQQNDRYRLEPQHIARLLEAWDNQLTTEQRSAVRQLASADRVEVRALRDAVATRPSGGGRGGTGGGTPPPPTGTGTPAVGPQITDPIRRRQDTVSAGAMVTLAALVELADWLNSIIERREFEQTVRPALASAEAQARAHWQDAPSDGAVIRATYRQAWHPDTPMTGPRRFGWVDVGFGHTREEAAVDIARQASITAGLGSHERWVEQFVWLPPRTPAPPSDYRTPWPRGSIVRPAGGGTTLRLRNVKWDVDGFDDEGTSSVTFPAAADARLHALQPPRMFARSEIPVVTRAAAAGGSLAGINLDPIMPGNAVGVPVFPMTRAAESALGGAPAVARMVPMPLTENLSLVRFAHPGDLEIVP